MLGRWLPSREGILRNRLLRRLGPRLQDSLLWHMNRRTVARGAAIGVFFGLLVPVAQIPAAAVAAVCLRANVWIAAIATLISNPLTYAPIYLYAYRVGSALLPPAGDPIPAGDHAGTVLQWLSSGLQWMTGMGRSIAVGALLMAVTGAVLAYAGVLLSWRLRVMLRRNALLRRPHGPARAGPGFSSQQGPPQPSMQATPERGD